MLFRVQPQFLDVEADTYDGAECQAIIAVRDRSQNADLEITHCLVSENDAPEELNKWRTTYPVEVVATREFTAEIAPQHYLSDDGTVHYRNYQVRLYQTDGADTSTEPWNFTLSGDEIGCV